VALEGLNSPIDSLVAAKTTATTSAPAPTEAPLLSGEGMAGDDGISLLPAFENGNGTSSELIHRIRALRQRAVRSDATP
jgi:hypothetical protein